MIKQLKLYFFGSKPRISSLAQIQIDEFMYNIDEDNIHFNLIGEDHDLEVVIPIENCVQVENQKWTKYVTEAIMKFVPKQHFEIFQYVQQKQDEELKQQNVNKGY